MIRNKDFTWEFLNGVAFILAIAGGAIIAMVMLSRNNVPIPEQTASAMMPQNT